MKNISSYNIIWFENGSLYTFTTETGRVTVSYDEAIDEGYPIVYSQADIDEAVETGQRFAISSGKMVELLGIV